MNPTGRMTEVVRHAYAWAVAGAVMSATATTATLNTSESSSSYGAIADTGSRWSGGIAPKNSGGSAIDYEVPSGYTLMVSGEKGKTAWRPYGTGNYYLFGGKSLTLNGGTICLSGWNGGGGAYAYDANPAFTFSNDGLILKSGTVTTLMDSNGKYGIYAGKVKFDTASNANVKFTNNGGRDNEYRFTGALSGTADSTILLDCSGVVRLRFSNAAGYLGKYYFRQTNKYVYTDCLRAAALRGGGYLTVTGADNANTVGAIDLWNPMTITITNILSGITVTGSYGNTSTLTLDFSGWDGNLGVVSMTSAASTTIIPLLMLGADAVGTVDQSKINLLYPSHVYGLNGRTYELVRNEKGIYIRLTQTHPVWKLLNVWESAGKADGYNNASYWETGTVLPKEKEASAYDYFVSVANGLRINCGDSHSHRIIVGKGSYICRSNWSGEMIFPNEGIWLDDGAQVHMWAANCTLTLGGKVTVCGSADNPVVLDCGSGNANAAVAVQADALYGDDAAVLRTDSAGNFVGRLENAAHYTGSIIAGYKLQLGACGADGLAGLAAEENATIEFLSTTAMSVKNAKFAAGATLKPCVSGSEMSALTVTEALTLSSPLTISLPVLPDPPVSASSKTYPVLRVAGGSFTLDDFTIVAPAAHGSVKTEWSVSTDGTGYRCLLLKRTRSGLCILLR